MGGRTLLPLRRPDTWGTVCASLEGRRTRTLRKARHRQVRYKESTPSNPSSTTLQGPGPAQDVMGRFHRTWRDSALPGRPPLD